MSKPRLASKTILFNLAMIVVEVVHGSMALLQPILTMDQFAVASMLIGIIHGAGGYYLRLITTGPVK